MKFVKKPNCPEKAAAVFVAANTPVEVVKGLERLGIKLLYGGRIAYAIEAVQYHIDTQIFHAGDDRFVVSPLLLKHYTEILPGAFILAGESVSQGNYPDDAAYNVASIGRFAVHNFKYTDTAILSELKGEKIQVSQGYSKCSLCIVDENSVITEDAGIARVLKRHNIDVLEISAGDVKLSGLDYGFLGGASGKISKNLLAFTGDITSHRDYGKILKFCTDRDVKPISLCDGKLTDIGSIIPVLEKE